MVLGRRQTDIQTDSHFFIAVLESWDAKMGLKKFLSQSEKKTDGTHYGIIHSEGSWTNKNGTLSAT